MHDTEKPFELTNAELQRRAEKAREELRKRRQELSDRLKNPPEIKSKNPEPPQIRFREPEQTTPVRYNLKGEAKEVVSDSVKYINAISRTLGVGGVPYQGGLSFTYNDLSLQTRPQDKGYLSGKITIKRQNPASFSRSIDLFLEVADAIGFPIDRSSFKSMAAEAKQALTYSDTLMLDYSFMKGHERMGDFFQVTLMSSDGLASDVNYKEGAIRVRKFGNNSVILSIDPQKAPDSHKYGC